MVAIHSTTTFGFYSGAVSQLWDWLLLASARVNRTLIGAGFVFLKISQSLKAQLVDNSFTVSKMELGTELEEYVRSVCTNIQKGIVEGLTLDGAIEFELAVVNTKEDSGGLKLFVLDAKGHYNKEEISKIKFKIARKPRQPKVGGGTAPSIFDR